MGMVGDPHVVLSGARGALYIPFLYLGSVIFVNGLELGVNQCLNAVNSAFKVLFKIWKCNYVILTLLSS